MLDTPTSSSLESRLRRTDEQLLDQQQQGQRHERTNCDDSPFINDDKEFQELIRFLSANDDNILKFFLES